MARTALKKHLRPVLARALRMLVVFTLAFSTTLGAQGAYAASQDGAGAVTAQAENGGGAKQDGAKQDDETDKGGGKPKTDPDPEPSSSSTPAEPEVGHYIEDFGMYLRVDEAGNETPTSTPEQVRDLTPFAYASSGRVVDSGIDIEKRDGQVTLGVLVEWSDVDDQCDPGPAYVTYSVDDASLATINPETGMLKATGGKNGTVVVTAEVKGDHTEDGRPLAVQATVDLVNQESTPYVTGIEIWNGEKNITRGSYTFPEGETMKTATIALQAKVMTHDPVTGEDKEYTLSVGNGLAKQTAGAVADITWEVVYDDRGSISAEGEYRAIVEGDNTVRAVTHAGANGTELVAETMIVLEGAGHAQGSLTIDAVWETQPDTVVKNEMLSVSDIEQIGTKTQSYTVYGSFGNSNFVTYTGRGVLLSDLLKKVGIDDAGVAALRLDCYDAKGYEVSWDLLVGKNRYYFPNMDIGSQAEAVQVAPMIAIDSARAPEGSSDPVATGKLTNDDCFRLLFGVGIDDEGQNTRQMQRRWINAIHITLAGGPKAERGNREPGKGGGPDPDTPSPNREQPKLGDPTNAAPDDGAAAPGGMGSEAGAATSGAGGGADGGGQAGRRNQGAWSILQAVNKNDSDVDEIEFDNPFRPYTAPACAGLFAAGACEVVVRFRWQKRKPELGRVRDA